MNKEEKINSILDDLVNSGSNIDYLNELKQKSLDISKKDNSLEDVLSSISDDIKNQTEAFLSQKNQNGTNYISGISTCVYLPDFNNNGEYKLKLIGGNKSINSELKIDEETLFDVASITKLYTLLLLFKLEEIGLINLDTKISDINPDFQKLDDFTLNDLVRLHGELKTEGNVAQAKSSEEAYSLLKTLYLTSNSREQNKYTDFGAIVISDTIEKIVSKELGRNMTFDQIMNKFLLDPLNLNHTTFHPNNNNISGNGNDLGLVHDPKARILGRAVGHAGIFTTSDDLAKLSKEIYSVNYINKEHISKLGEITFPNSPQNNKGNLGIYVKHPLGYSKTYTPAEFSTGSFSHQGWTGSVATFDPHNMIHNNILVNAIYENGNPDLIKNNKPIGFGDAFEEYQKEIMKNVMLMYVAKKYYNKYCDQKQDIVDTKFIK